MNCRRRSYIDGAVSRRRRGGWAVGRRNRGFRGAFLGGPPYRHFLEKRVARWRQFRTVRAQAFDDPADFAGDTGAKLLRVRTARSAQSACCHRITCKRIGG